MLVEGRIERQAEQVEDATAWGDAGLARTNEVRRPDPGSAEPTARMPASRDFR